MWGVRGGGGGFGGAGRCSGSLSRYGESLPQTAARAALCLPGRQASVGAVGGRGERAGPAGGVALRRPANGVARGALGVSEGDKHQQAETQESESGTPPAGAGWSYHIAAAVAGVLQVVVQQLGGAVLEGLGQSAQQHGELGRVELKQGDQDHLGRLEETWRRWVRRENILGEDGEGGEGGGGGGLCFNKARTLRRSGIVLRDSGKPPPRLLRQKVSWSPGG